MAKKKKKVKRENEIGRINFIAFWAPRVLMATYIGMINAFMFREGIQGIGKLIPIIFLLIFLTIAWQWEIVGGWSLIGLGIIFGIFFEAFQSSAGFRFLVLPIWLIGTLFLLDHHINR